jgi:Protein of unknown function (DUF4229)
VGHQTASEPGARRAVLTYNLYRLGLLAVCLGIGWLLKLPGLVLIVSALFVSGVLSWFLLGRQRVAMGLAVERTVAKGQARMAARAAAEDGYVDRMLAEPNSSLPGPEAASSVPQTPATTRGDQPAP